MRQKEVGLYIHIPFCKQKCEYCDFYSVANKDELIPQYVQSLLNEIKGVSNSKNLDFIPIVTTIYIGGGTPSYLKSNFISQILSTIYENYQVVKDAEITVEVNPGTVTLDKLEEYVKAGVNRLSIGLQTTHDYLLQKIGRIHNYYDFLDTYHFAREVGIQNINVDLMLGLPEQTLIELQDSVEEVISLEPEHISVYSLILEEGTKLEKKVLEGELKLPSEEEERSMYWKTKELLEESGYIHYEISNFAKPNYQAKHNLDCWNQKEYIGFGAGAHSYINGVRYSNISSIKKYLLNDQNRTWEKNRELHEKQNQEAKQKEYMLLGLRKIEGVSVQEFKSKFVANPIYLYHTELEKLSEEKLLEIDGDTIKLTNKGLDLANLVWEEFV